MQVIAERPVCGMISPEKGKREKRTMLQTQSHEEESVEQDQILDAWLKMEEDFPKAGVRNFGFVNTGKKIVRHYCDQTPTLAEERLRVLNLRTRFQRAADVCALVKRREQGLDKLIGARLEYNQAKTAFHAVGTFRRTRWGRLIKGVVSQLFPNAIFPEEQHRATLISASTLHRSSAFEVNMVSTLIEQEAGRPDLSIGEAEKIRRGRERTYEKHRTAFREALISSLAAKRSVHPAYGRMASFVRKVSIP
jgi:hypothetical protein